jgi:ATP-dependent Clp protease ATP-binding subunit ClpA
MFERFTDRARRVVVLAQEDARMLGHNHIGTEHLLLGLLHESDGVAARALAALDVDLEAARDKVEEMVVGGGQSAPADHIPFTPRAKKVLELSLREALQLGHSYIGTEHILLGLIREGEGVGAQVLVRQGVELHRVRDVVMDLLGSAEPPGDPPRRWFRRDRPTPAVSVSRSEEWLEPSPSPFEHLDDGAWDALVAARRCARQRAASEIAAQDLLAGVAAVPGPGADALRAAGLVTATLDAAAQENDVDAGDPPAALPYSDNCRGVLHQAVDEALRREHAAVGTAHLLYALLLWSDHQIVPVLERAGIGPADLHAETARRLA